MPQPDEAPSHVRRRASDKLLAETSEVPEAFPYPRGVSASGSLVLRAAEPADAAVISSLLDELGHPLAEEAVVRQLGRIAKLGPGAFVVVAVSGGTVVGVSSGFATPVLHREELVGRLSVLVVARAHAGRGIGATLVRDAEERFRAQGCGRLELTSAAHRTEAHAFYRRLGYAQQGVRLTRELSRG